MEGHGRGGANRSEGEVKMSTCSQVEGLIHVSWTRRGEGHEFVDKKSYCDRHTNTLINTKYEGKF